MVGRYTRLIFIAILTMIVFAAVKNVPTYATLELYTWKDYKTIEAQGGIYGVIAKTGGAAQTDFSQNSDTPAAYEAEGPSDSCKGTLILNLTSDTAATLTSKDDCSPFQNADKTVAIGGKPIAITSVENEEKQMIDASNQDVCNDTNSQISTNCINDNNQKIADIQSGCLADHNYKQNVSEANAYLDCISQGVGQPRPGSEPPKQPDDAPEECTLNDTGWVVCQMNLFISKLADFTFTLLQPFLVVKPLDKDASGADSATYQAWMQLRTLANVVMVIAFLVIIYSYLSNMGVSIYNVKRMLPRLIVAAILINASFIICSIGIDASNIAGATIQDIIKKMDDVPKSNADEFPDWTSLTKKIQSTGPTSDDDATTGGTNKTAASNNNQPQATSPTTGAGATPTNGQPDANDPKATKMVMGGIEITGIAVMFVQLSALVPIMVMSLFAMLTVLLVLLLRQALIIVLVILAPLAFACFLLPNTERWFKRWREIFVDMLVLFPAISLIYGASFLASNVIRKTAEANGQVLLGIFSLGIAVIPLFIAPLLIKISSGVLSQFAGVVNNKRKGVYDRSMNRAHEFRDDRKAIRQLNAANGKTFFGKIPVTGKRMAKARSFANRMRPINRKATSEKKHETAEWAANQAETKYNAEHSQNINDRTLKYVNNDAAASISEALSGMAAGELENIQIGEVNASFAAMRSEMNDRSLSREDVLAMAKTGERNGKLMSEADQRAAIRLAGEQFRDAMNEEGIDGTDKAAQILATSGSRSVNIRREIIDAERKAGIGNVAPEFSGSGYGKVEGGSLNSMADVQKMTISAVNGGKYSARALAGASTSRLRVVANNLNHPDLDAQAVAQLRSDAQTVLTTPNLSSGLRPDARAELERIAR